MTRNPVLRHNEPMDQSVDSLLSRLTEAPVCPANGRGVEHFKTFAMEAEQASPDLAMVLRDGRAEMLLRGVFEGSPYLTTLATRDSDPCPLFATARPNQHRCRSCKPAASVPVSTHLPGSPIRLPARPGCACGSCHSLGPSSP